MISRRVLAAASVLALGFWSAASVQPPDLSLNDQDYFEGRALNVLVFHNWYSGLFSDSKLSGIELIHHGVRTATNGDVRLSNTPEQWDPIPEFIEKKVDRANRPIQAFLTRRLIHLRRQRG
jgi:hypothetical protein